MVPGVSLPTTYTNAEILEYVREAIVAVVSTGQGYVTGLGMSVTKADLDKLYKLETLYTRRTNSASGAGRAGVRFGGA